MSPNEINISGIHRTLIGESLGDCDKLISNSEIGYNEVFELIEICRAEMEQLLKNSIERFQIDEN